MEVMSRRSDINWVAVETEYRIGQLTIRMLSFKYGVAASSITRRAKRKGWRRRDLVRFIRELGRAKLCNDSRREQTVENELQSYLRQFPYRE
jgi:hypothetical protein